MSFSQTLAISNDDLTNSDEFQQFLDQKARPRVGVKFGSNLVHVVVECPHIPRGFLSRNCWSQLNHHLMANMYLRKRHFNFGGKFEFRSQFSNYNCITSQDIFNFLFALGCLVATYWTFECSRAFSSFVLKTRQVTLRHRLSVACGRVGFVE